MSTTNGTLTFSDPVIEDEGSYQCMAKNKHGLATFPRQVVKKTFLDGFKDDSVHVIEVQEGQPLKIECTAPNGYPKPNLFWLVQTSSGELYPIEDPRKTFDSDGNLWFSHVNADDALKSAYYTCAAAFALRNEYKLGKRVQLNVTHASKDSHLKSTPIMQYVSSPHVVALRGHRTELFCIYSGSPSVEVNWKINGTAVNYDKRVLKKNFGKSLLIRDTRLDDRGTYTCDVSNGAKGNQSSLISVDVLAAPYFTVRPLSKAASENGTVEFLCEARAKPLPDVIWTHNGRVMNSIPGDRVSALKDKLIIKDLIKSDAGNYGCNATNELGFAYHDFYLEVDKSQSVSLVN
jgi:neuronal cell adhesion molecule